MTSKLAIIGMGKGWRSAPWGKDGWDIWTLNAAWRQWDQAFLKRGRIANLRAWFELHRRRYLKQEWNGENEHFDFLQGISACMPIYVQCPSEWRRFNGNACSLPIEALRKRFPRADYHASSLDWMLAVALLKPYKDIHYWGVDFGPLDVGEPLSARACLEYWIGIAEGMGHKVTIHEPTGLFWIYNYSRTKVPYHQDDTWRLMEKR